MNNDLVDRPLHLSPVYVLLRKRKKRWWLTQCRNRGETARERQVFSRLKLNSGKNKTKGKKIQDFLLVREEIKMVKIREKREGRNKRSVFKKLVLVLLWWWLMHLPPFVCFYVKFFRVKAHLFNERVVELLL